MSMWVFLKSSKKKILSKEKVYSSLTGKEITDEKYEHGLKAWDKLKMKTMKEYHDFYLKCNV